MKRAVILLAILSLTITACSSQPYQAAEDAHDVPDLPGEGELSNADLFGPSLVEVTAGPVEYADGISGFLAEPAEPGDYPGVVMIHEWWGLNEEVRQMAENLAGKGYRVLAVDLYGGKSASTSPEAMALVRSVGQESANENMKLAADFLRETGSSRLASLGWCFGGKQSLQLSLAEDMDATVIYYGNLETDPEVLSSLKGPVLGIFGAEDDSIPIDAVKAFERGLNEASIENQVHIYKGAGHAFANPSGSRFKPGETKDAWNKTVEFLEDNLKK